MILIWPNASEKVTQVSGQRVVAKVSTGVADLVSLQLHPGGLADVCPSGLVFGEKALHLCGRHIKLGDP